MSSSPRPTPSGLPRPPAVSALRGRVRRFRGSRQRVLEETSAGGICVKVVDAVPYVALIARINRSGKREWCLPKGHIEAGETAAEAAAREIAEEAGVTGRLLRELCSIEYWFSNPHSRVHKRVHHFLLEYQHGEITVENDPDREAEEAAWVDLRDAVNLLAYPNERRVVEVALELLYAGR